MGDDLARPRRRSRESPAPPSGLVAQEIHPLRRRRPGDSQLLKLPGVLLRRVAEQLHAPRPRPEDQHTPRPELLHQTRRSR